MSKPREFEIVCDKCKHTENFHAWDSINVDLDPKMKDKVLSEEIFHWICPQCGERYYVPFSFLYHDMKHATMIQFIPNHSIEQEEEVDVPFNIGEYRYRNVYDINELKEKIFILDAELDDRVVEFVKFICLPQIQDKNKDVKDILFAHNKGGKLWFVQILENEDAGQLIGIDLGLYEKLKDQLTSLGAMEPSNKFININANWIIKLLNESD